MVRTVFLIARHRRGCGAEAPTGPDRGTRKLAAHAIGGQRGDAAAVEPDLVACDWLRAHVTLRVVPIPGFLKPSLALQLDGGYRGATSRARAAQLNRPVHPFDSRTLAGG
jgi:hypothetical protein